MSNKKTWWTPIVSFAGHVLVGTIMFLILSAATILIAVLVRQLQILEIPALTIQVLKFVEYALLIADALIYLAYTAYLTWNFFKEMTK